MAVLRGNATEPKHLHTLLDQVVDMERVIVVQDEVSGQLIKVCGSWDDFDAWLSLSEWERHDVDASDARVYQ